MAMGTHLVLLGLEDNSESLFVSWQNSNGLLVYQAVVTERAHICEIVLFLERQMQSV